MKIDCKGFNIKEITLSTNIKEISNQRYLAN